MHTRFGWCSHFAAASSTASGIVAVKRHTWGLGLVPSPSFDSRFGARTRGLTGFFTSSDAPTALRIASSWASKPRDSSLSASSRATYETLPAGRSPDREGRQDERLQSEPDRGCKRKWGRASRRCCCQWSQWLDCINVHVPSWAITECADKSCYPRPQGSNVHNKFRSLGQ